MVTGFAVIGCVVLTATGTTDLAAVLQDRFAVAFASTIAVLDVVGGLILVLRNKEIVLSLASHQEKTNNRANQTDNNP